MALRMTREEAVLMLDKIGFRNTAKNDNAWFTKKVNKIREVVDDDTELTNDETADALLRDVLNELEEGGEVVVSDEVEETDETENVDETETDETGAPITEEDGTADGGEVVVPEDAIDEETEEETGSDENDDVLGLSPAKDVVNETEMETEEVSETEPEVETEEPAAIEEPKKKKRGRPKGTKNKPKGTKAATAKKNGRPKIMGVYAAGPFVRWLGRNDVDLEGAKKLLAGEGISHLKDLSIKQELREVRDKNKPAAVSDEHATALKEKYADVFQVENE